MAPAATTQRLKKIVIADPAAATVLAHGVVIWQISAQNSTNLSAALFRHCFFYSRFAQWLSSN